VDTDLRGEPPGPHELRNGFNEVVQRWQKFYRLRPEYKLAVSDMQTFLTDLRSWLEQIELGTRSLSAAEREQAEAGIARDLLKSATPALDSFFERFETATKGIEPELQAAHRVFCRRQLHSLLMSCPFMHRIYSKPLGYAGDYEMMNMIWRNAAEGGSLFAKVLTLYILDQAPARSVRNRIEFMTRRILEETLRVSLSGQMARIFSLGCGPAREVQNFLPHSLAERAEFQLLDFNRETLDYTGGRMEEVKRKHHRTTPITLLKKSVYYLLKEASKPAQNGEDAFDLIYSSGLYDYLNDRVSRSLNTHLYEQLRPGGALIISNFDASNPIQNLMEYAFEWFLLHRDSRQMLAMAPEQASADRCVVRADPTGCNIFLEVRKPPAKQ
jgi:extracellular factor (EF) 3-hydroxypalmitic acid methyl ester biosynthesis protein